MSYPLSSAFTESKWAQRNDISLHCNEDGSIDSVYDHEPMQ